MYLSKKAVLEWLDDRRYKSPWIESFRDRLESGAFDADESEAQRLRAELCELEEENRKLRERLKEELVWQGECLKLEEQLQSAQQDRDKLIEGLRKLYCIMKTDHDEAHEAEAYDVCDLLEEPLEIVQNILHEIGVTLE